MKTHSEIAQMFSTKLIGIVFFMSATFFAFESLADDTSRYKLPLIEIGTLTVQESECEICRYDLSNLETPVIRNGVPVIISEVDMSGKVKNVPQMTNELVIGKIIEKYPLVQVKAYDVLANELTKQTLVKRLSASNHVIYINHVKLLDKETLKLFASNTIFIYINREGVIPLDNEPRKKR